MPRRDIIFCTTKTEHILQPTLSMGRSQGGGRGGREEEVNLTALKHVRPSKKNQNVSLPDFYKKKRAGERFFFFLVISELFNSIECACFLYTLLPSPS